MEKHDFVVSSTTTVPDLHELGLKPGTPEIGAALIEIARLQREALGPSRSEQEALMQQSE